MIWKGQREEKACSHQKKKKKRRKKKKKERKKKNHWVHQAIPLHRQIRFLGPYTKRKPRKRTCSRAKELSKTDPGKDHYFIGCLGHTGDHRDCQPGWKNKKKSNPSETTNQRGGGAGGGGGEEKGCSSETRNQRPKRPPSDNSIVEGLYSSCVPINRLFVEVMSETNWLKIKSKICLAAMCCQLPHVTCKILLFYF